MARADTNANTQQVATCLLRLGTQIALKYTHVTRLMYIMYLSSGSDTMNTGTLIQCM